MGTDGWAAEASLWTAWSEPRVLGFWAGGFRVWGCCVFGLGLGFGSRVCGRIGV